MSGVAASGEAARSYWKPKTHIEVLLGVLAGVLASVCLGFSLGFFTKGFGRGFGYKVLAGVRLGFWL